MVGEGLPHSEKDIGKEDMEKGSAVAEVMNVETKLVCHAEENSSILEDNKKTTKPQLDD
jgi:hypothetical protein